MRAWNHLTEIGENQRPSASGLGLTRVHTEVTSFVLTGSEAQGDGCACRQGTGVGNKGQRSPAPGSGAPADCRLVLRGDAPHVPVCGLLTRPVACGTPAQLQGLCVGAAATG